ncbi:delta 1-pyrroline-5-carboxylate synthetase [Candidatus Bathyarchaeota archaeon]|nr:delta 1-pyrroline-5-carboxylate synthetase [Candidatus Bathyarchaeota archaeon]
MEAVLKVGGSLAEEPTSLVSLCRMLSVLAKAHRIVVVPGGGEFADTVRRHDRTYGFSKRVAHQMAILAMDQYGLLLSDFAPDSYVAYNQEEISSSVSGILPIFLPSKHMFHKDPLEHSWDVTSDTIAAHIASVLHAEKLILVTDVDGIFSKDPKQNWDATFIEELSAKELFGSNMRTSVDKTLPKMLLQTKLDCYVVNGRQPERIGQLLENRKTVCTHITV